jgi:hypothetical protein
VAPRRREREVILMPIWICALLAIVAATLIAFTLPADWDQRRRSAAAGVVR